MNSENMERSVMEDRLDKELHAILVQTRHRMNFTQAKMARRYVMAKNTYSDLEGKKHGFGTLTTLLLLKDQEDPKKVIDDLVEKLEKALEEVTILV